MKQLRPVAHAARSSAISVSKRTDEINKHTASAGHAVGDAVGNFLVLNE